MPEALKGKSKAEIRSYITKKRAERVAIQEEIQQLNLKRKDHILKQQKKGENGLESAMIKAIKTQAQKKKYKW